MDVCIGCAGIVNRPDGILDQLSALIDQFSNAGADHNKNRVDALFAAKDRESCDEVYRHPDLEVPCSEMDGAVFEQSGDQDDKTRGEDHGDDGRTERLQNPLHEGELSVLVVQPGEDGDKNAGGKNDAESGDPGTWNACNPVADEGRRVDGDGAGSHLGDGHEIREVFDGEPPVFVNHLGLNQRHGGVAASETESTNL